MLRTFTTLFWEVEGSMQGELKFADFVKRPENMSEQADFDLMNDNYHALEHIIDRFYFSKFPKHPKIFSILFSDPNFPTTLEKHLELYGVKTPDKVIFTEYSSEDRDKLIDLGILKPKAAQSHTLLVIHTFNNNVCFINVFYNE